MTTVCVNMIREFVKYKNQEFKPEIIRIDGGLEGQLDYPALSIIIPTADGYRGGYFSKLLDQLKIQTFQNFEIIIVKGDRRQGRAINTGASLAKGDLIMTMDDDTRIGHSDLLLKLVEAMHNHPDIGMAGVPNLIPEDESWLVKRVMQEIPRRSSKMVNKVTTSDMAEHPCLIMRKDLFFNVGGENELIPRGLDPYLRHVFRKAGFKVVVIPEVYIHHLPPNRLWKLLKQFFRNGFAASYVNKFYPQWVYELTTDHHDLENLKIRWPQRIMRQFVNLARAIYDQRFIFFINQVAYLAGFFWGILRIREVNDL